MFTLDQVVPWGRSFEEYRQMFALTDTDLQSRILGCADGPASFNTEATRRGTGVVSFDPLYRFDGSQIRERIAATSDQVLEQTRQNAGEFVWDTISSVEHLATVRMSAMQAFLDDYDAGRHQGRYVEAELPTLPFPDASFDLAVCSHFLFLYTAQLTEAFHQAAAVELCRVAREVRIFPLLTLGGGQSPYVERVVEFSRRRGHDVAIEVVPYEFRRGGNQMMRIRSLALR
jgi:SAM-dependent methyltransferase